MEYIAENYDVAVIGAGHAGTEAALASARLGCATVIFTINMDAVGNLPCNPSIGGTAKGHLVREVDALGGEMGRAADDTFIQSRMLNRGKGPAVHSLRAQIDRRKYSARIKHALELQPHLDLKQAEIIEIRPSKGEFRWQLVTKMGAVYSAKCVIIATGTYLGGRIYVGDVAFEGGPDGMFAATCLGKCLRELGLPCRRFKTGTPARIHRASIDFSHLEEQAGDEEITPFSYDTLENPDFPLENKVVCHVTWTNERTKQIILDNIHRSPLYSGKIDGIGPRYCPSIEDKIVRFSEKERHQLFIEPCGLDTEEMYLQGASSSLPEDVQIALYRSIPGLEHVKIMRTAYAIEYDCIDPLALRATLECKDFPGLYGAGQFNGSSGYEEAAAQGIVAGINAALSVLGREQVIFPRSGSYIGTLIDDLVTKGVADPYRMMTSRSEYRLILRQDNADERLMPLGHAIGLVSDERYRQFLTRTEFKKQELKRVRDTAIPASEEVNSLLVSHETTPINNPVRLIELLKRPELNYQALEPVDSTRPDIPPYIFEQVEVEIKYEGYIKRQQAMIDEANRLEAKKLPADMDYSAITGLRLEAIEKLGKIRPESIGQASRISGVSPADISVLLIWLAKNSHQSHASDSER
ncbi:MAG: tRNA uridine-5-carboxymethylaminomethyl(34) synthesis enzyme MnmG [Clostridia bacterium]|nr:tRNA uridine-5-carboxymethylaminomethyl(34) synthesis enzyme MnmG [Clostridia bacterium]